MSTLYPPRSRAMTAALTSLPSARPRTWGMMALITLPMSPGPDAPTSDMVCATSAAISSADSWLGHILHDDFELGALLVRKVLAVALRERLDAVPALLRLAGQDLDNRVVVQVFLNADLLVADCRAQKADNVASRGVAVAHRLLHVVV